MRWTAPPDRIHGDGVHREDDRGHRRTTRRSSTSAAWGTSVTPACRSSFELLDSAGQGIRWTLDGTDLPDESWHELAVSRADGTISLDGGPSIGSPTFDAGTRRAEPARGDRERLERRGHVQAFPRRGAPARPAHRLGRGTPGRGLVEQVRRSLEGRQRTPDRQREHRPEAVPRDGRVHLAVRYAGRGEGDITSRTEIGVDILYARLRADIVLRGVGGEFVGSGGHRLTIPATPSVVTFSDTFSLTGSNEFSREDVLRVQPFERAHRLARREGGWDHGGALAGVGSVHRRHTARRPLAGAGPRVLAGIDRVHPARHVVRRPLGAGSGAPGSLVRRARPSSAPSIWQPTSPRHSGR